MSLQSSTKHVHLVLCVLSQDCLTAEEQDPILPKLQPLLQGKILIVAMAAMMQFEKLLQQFGGCKEKQRWQELQKRITEVAPVGAAAAIADADLSDALVSQSPHSHMQSPESLQGRVRRLQGISAAQKEVFALGDDQHAVTLTANGKASAFAARQGVHLEVSVHRAVWLTGQ